jgi:hypothetical protein
LRLARSVLGHHLREVLRSRLDQPGADHLVVAAQR